MFVSCFRMVAVTLVVSLVVLVVSLVVLVVSLVRQVFD